MSTTARPRLMRNRVHRPAYLNLSPRAEKEKRAREKLTINPIARALYASSQWKALRAEVLRLSGGRCVTPGCMRRPTIADHITPHRCRQELFYDAGNLQAMCKPCHDRKTARYDGGRGNRRRVAPSLQPVLPAGLMPRLLSTSPEQEVEP